MQAPAKSDALRKTATKGVVYSVGGQAAKNVLRLGSNILLTQLLTKADFGLATLVNTVIMALEMTSDIGIETSIVQHKDGENPKFLDTAFTVQFLRGAILFLMGCLMAYPASIFWDAPSLQQLIPVAALGALVRGMWPTRLHVLRRHLQVKAQTIIDIVSQTVGVAVMAVHAYIYASVWALILGSVTIFTMPIIISQFLPGHRNHFRWDKTAARELIRFGKWIFISTAITFGASKFAVIASGRFVDKGMVGVFGISILLATLPQMIGSNANKSVLLPALAAAARSDRKTLVTSFYGAQRVVLPILLFLTLGLFLLSPAFFFVLYKEEYHPAGWMVQVGLFGVWFTYLQSAWTRALLALGLSRPLAVSNAINFVATATCVLTGYHYYGFVGLIAGGTLGPFAGYLSVVYAMHVEGFAVWRLDTKFAAMAIVLCGLGSLLPRQLATLLNLADWRPLSIATSLVFLIPVTLFTYQRLRHRPRANAPLAPAESGAN